jgi:diadenosine tetraphosphate (Ap4A) HIT family hydrolase
MDIGPVTSGHLLVVPRRHAAGLASLDEPTGQHLFAVAMRMAAALRRSGIRCEGINLLLADGPAAGQDVFHVHLHVIPRYSGDGFILDADWSSKPDRAELDRRAARIRQAHVSADPPAAG